MKRKGKVGEIIKLDINDKDIEVETIILNATGTIYDLSSLLPAPSSSHLSQNFILPIFFSWYSSELREALFAVFHQPLPLGMMTQYIPIKPSNSIYIV